MGEQVKVFEVLGTDVFEFESEVTKDGVTNRQKDKFLIWRDRGSGLTMIDHLKKYQDKENWEPSTQHIIKSFNRWIMTYPAPKWVLADAG